MYWIVALLALVELGVGWSLDYLPEGSQSLRNASLAHLALGVAIAVLVVVVPLWRLFSRSADYPAGTPHWLRIALRISESLLFVLLLASALTGYLSWEFAGGAIPEWTHWLPGSISYGPHAGPLFARWHSISAIAVTFPILATLVLLGWGALKGHPVRRRRRVLALPSPQAEPQPAREPRATLELQEAREEAQNAAVAAESLGLAKHLKIFGAIGFWGQLCLGLIAALVLIVTSSSSYYTESLNALPYDVSWARGIFWAYLSLGLLALTDIGFYSCTLLARSLRRGEVPGGGAPGAKRLVSSINLGSALGLTTAILGTAFSIALLISKTVSQPPGIAITDPAAIVRAVDVFVLLANFSIVVAHFIGILICLWMLNRLHRFDSWPKPSSA